MADALEVENKVLAESRRFRASLPSLMAEHPGQWVVFYQGTVVSAHDTEEEAYLAGLKDPGPGSGHVVVQVREPDEVFIGALWTDA